MEQKEKQFMTDEQLEDQVCVCKDCGQEFIFRARVNAQDLENYFTPDIAEKLIQNIQTMEDRVDDLTRASRFDEAMECQEELVQFKDTIQRYADVQSQELYSYHGFSHSPARCPQCQAKIKGEAQNRGNQKKR